MSGRPVWSLLCLGVGALPGIPVSQTPISTLQQSISVSVKSFGSALVAAAPFFVALLALAAGLAFSTLTGLAAAFDAAAFGALAAGAAFSALALAGALAALLALAAGAAALTGGSSSRVRLPRVPAIFSSRPERDVHTKPNAIVRRCWMSQC